MLIDLDETSIVKFDAGDVHSDVGCHRYTTGGNQEMSSPNSLPVADSDIDPLAGFSSYVQIFGIRNDLDSLLLEESGDLCNDVVVLACGQSRSASITTTSLPSPRNA